MFEYSAQAGDLNLPFYLGDIKMRILICQASVQILVRLQGCEGRHGVIMLAKAHHNQVIIHYKIYLFSFASGFKQKLL